MLILFLAVLPLLAWLYLALAHGRFWQPLTYPPAETPRALPRLDIIVPARNEADILPLTLPALLNQDYAGDWRVLLVDDHSQDGTAPVAHQIAAATKRSERLRVIQAPDLPTGWSGKVAAMQAGVAQSDAEWILFTDADIWHPRFSLTQLIASAESRKRDLVSRLVKLNSTSLAEQLLIPAFVFFFALLYPFRRANDPHSPVAAAAGGVLLIRRAMLDKSGGLIGIKSALIDDCSLARAVKDSGGAIELTLTQDIHSLRPYPHFADIERMIARTAYTQLRHAPLLLLGTVLGMLLLFLAPPFFFFFATNLWELLCGFFAFMLMSALYLPMLRFYDLPRAYVLTLPFAALFYVGATLDSARQSWRGTGGFWKGRAQA